MDKIIAAEEIDPICHEAIPTGIKIKPNSGSKIKIKGTKKNKSFFLCLNNLNETIKDKAIIIFVSNFLFIKVGVNTL